VLLKIIAEIKIYRNKDIKKYIKKEIIKRKKERKK
jgi:hypothetical protein